MIITITPETIGDKEYLTVSQMAALTNRSDQSVYKLINRGNTIRQMKCLRIAGRVLIPISEVTEFPFTPVGINNEDKEYHYTKEGESIETASSD